MFWDGAILEVYLRNDGLAGSVDRIVSLPRRHGLARSLSSQVDEIDDPREKYTVDAMRVVTTAVVSSPKVNLNSRKYRLFEAS